MRIVVNVLVIIGSKAVQRPKAIIDVAIHMQIALNADSAVIGEFEKAATGVNEPQFAGWCRRRRLHVRIRSADDNRVLRVRLLGYDQHLIAGLRGAHDAPPRSRPR